MNELQAKNSVKVLQGSIEFLGYEQLKTQALEVAKIIRETEVNEETVKHAKKLLASANKAVNELEDRRISIKKELMEPYQDFELKVKEIVGIVKEADNEIRSKVRELEQLERDEKESQLKEIWGLRYRPYRTAPGFLTFEDWLTPQHLNKTMSIKKAEEDMAQWMEARSRDVMVIMDMEHGVDILSEYRNCLDLGMAVATVNQRTLDREKIERVMPKTEHTAPVTIFIIEDPKDAALAEMLMKANNVTYKKETK